MHVHQAIRILVNQSGSTVPLYPYTPLISIHTPYRRPYIRPYIYIPISLPGDLHNLEHTSVTNPLIPLKHERTCLAVYSCISPSALVTTASTPEALHTIADLTLSHPPSPFPSNPPKHVGFSNLGIPRSSGTLVLRKH